MDHGTWVHLHSAFMISRGGRKLLFRQNLQVRNLIFQSSVGENKLKCAAAEGTLAHHCNAYLFVQ
jgi:hypothetical protein